MIHALLYLLGVYPVPPGMSAFETFWDGFGSGPVAWCFVPIGYYVHHICHQVGCYRMGHPNQNGEVKCRRHL